MPERTYTPILIAVFSNDGLIHMTNTIDSLVMTELARLYVDMAFFGSAAKFIDEERWLQNRNLRAEVPIEHFFQELFKAELMPLLFLKDFFKSTKIEKIVSAGKLATEIENAVVQTAKSKKNAQHRISRT